MSLQMDIMEVKKRRAEGLLRSYLFSLLLMLLAQEVVHRLDGVEGAEADFNEDGAPVAHGTVPKAGEFEGLEFASALALVADEAGGLIDVAGEVELLATVVPYGADEVNGVEVGALLEHGFLGGVAHVNL